MIVIRFFAPPQARRRVPVEVKGRFRQHGGAVRRKNEDVDLVARRDRSFTGIANGKRLADRVSVGARGNRPTGVPSARKIGSPPLASASSPESTSNIVSVSRGGVLLMFM